MCIHIIGGPCYFGSPPPSPLRSVKVPGLTALSPDRGDGVIRVVAGETDGRRGSAWSRDDRSSNRSLLASLYGHVTTDRLVFVIGRDHTLSVLTSSPTKARVEQSLTLTHIQQRWLRQPPLIWKPVELFRTGAATTGSSKSVSLVRQLIGGACFLACSGLDRNSEVWAAHVCRGERLTVARIVDAANVQLPWRHLSASSHNFALHLTN